MTSFYNGGSENKLLSQIEPLCAYFEMVFLTFLLKFSLQRGTIVCLEIDLGIATSNWLLTDCSSPLVEHIKNGPVHSVFPAF